MPSLSRCLPRPVFSLTHGQWRRSHHNEASSAHTNTISKGTTPSVIGHNRGGRGLSTIMHWPWKHADGSRETVFATLKDNVSHFLCHLRNVFHFIVVCVGNWREYARSYAWPGNYKDIVLKEVCWTSHLLCRRLIKETYIVFSCRMWQRKGHVPGTWRKSVTPRYTHVTRRSQVDVFATETVNQPIHHYTKRLQCASSKTYKSRFGVSILRICKPNR